MREALFDLTAPRTDTPGCESVIHFNNAGCGLLARPVHRAMVEHLDLEARIGGYEAADVRATEIADFYAATAELIGSQPGEITFAASATDAHTRALSAIRIGVGTRNTSIGSFWFHPARSTTLVGCRPE